MSAIVRKSGSGGKGRLRVAVRVRGGGGVGERGFVREEREGRWKGRLFRSGLVVVVVVERVWGRRKGRRRRRVGGRIVCALFVLVMARFARGKGGRVWFLGFGLCEIWRYGDKG